MINSIRNYMLTSCTSSGLGDTLPSNIMNAYSYAASKGYKSTGYYGTGTPSGFLVI